MKVKFINLLAFIICLFFTIVSTLALFGDDSSKDILTWLGNRIFYLALVLIFGYMVYFLAPFVLKEEEE